MFEGKASQTYSHEYRYENWGQHEFTKGTWTQAFMERKSALKELNQPLDNKIYFAGEIAMIMALADGCAWGYSFRIQCSRSYAK